MNIEEYIGSSVSIRMKGGLGYYQGTISSINTEKQTIALQKAIHNGKPTVHSAITINASDIQNLSMIPKKKDEAKVTENNNLKLLTKNMAKLATNDVQTKKKVRTSVGETLAHNSPSSVSDSSPLKTAPQSNCASIVQPPKEKQDPQLNSSTNHPSNNFSSFQISDKNYCHPNDYNNRPYDYGGGRMNYDYGSPRRNDGFRTPNKRDHRQVQRTKRDMTTFSCPIDDDFINTEFDFEKNLALFDKRAVFDEIQNLKPDVVRGAERNYHHKENVISSKPISKNQITVPASGAADIVYATDNGLLVPSVTGDLRKTILSTVNQHGLTNSRQLEVIGRGATELILSLIGGSHRLEPDNSHQAPVVVLLCGGHFQGAAGVNTARQLECHGVRTVVVMPPMPTSPPPSLLLTHELQLYNLTAGTISSDIQSYQNNLDLIIDARVDQDGQVENTGNPGAEQWLINTTTWASNCRAPVLAIDPPSDLSPSQTLPPLPARILLCIALPLAYTPGRGKVYLLNLPIPQQTYSSLGIKYKPPFGSKLVIPLHPCE